MFKSLPASALAQRSVQYPYFIPRNSRGNLPVYTDIRNAGTRYLIHIRNVDGNASLLANELRESLFTLVITGGHWKNRIMEWLKAKGF
ncbi:hypothetical protein APHAL10511_001298 [Amanita phalloides]|nr:hypothetical protein APHAL10511_001298 [Amanita phalloides]